MKEAFDSTRATDTKKVRQFVNAYLMHLCDKDEDAVSQMRLTLQCPTFVDQNVLFLLGPLFLIHRQRIVSRKGPIELDIRNISSLFWSNKYK